LAKSVRRIAAAETDRANLPGRSIPHCSMSRQMVSLPAHDSRRGKKMKLVSTALVAAALAALGGCGGSEENVAADNIAEDTYNVAPDEGGADNLLGNEALGNDSGLDNTAGDNAVIENIAGNGQ
jgi:hypothetical protein